MVPASAEHLVPSNRQSHQNQHPIKVISQEIDMTVNLGIPKLISQETDKTNEKRTTP